MFDEQGFANIQVPLKSEIGLPRVQVNKINNVPAQIKINYSL